jgi:hypothetical protein
LHFVPFFSFIADLSKVCVVGKIRLNLLVFTGWLSPTSHKNMFSSYKCSLYAHHCRGMYLYISQLLEVITIGFPVNMSLLAELGNCTGKIQKLHPVDIRWLTCTTTSTLTSLCGFWTYIVHILYIIKYILYILYLYLYNIYIYISLYILHSWLLWYIYRL